MEYTVITGVNNGMYHVAVIDANLSKAVSLGYQDISGVFNVTAGRTPINYSLSADGISQDCGAFSRLSQYSGVVLTELVSERGTTLGYSVLSCSSGEIVNLRTEDIVKRSELLGNVPFLQNGIIRSGAVCCYPNKPFIKVTVKGKTYSRDERKKISPLGVNKVKADLNIIDLILAGKAKPLTGKESLKDARKLFITALKECLNRNQNGVLETVLGSTETFYKHLYLNGEMTKENRAIAESFIVPVVNTIEWVLGCPNLKLIMGLFEYIKVAFADGYYPHFLYSDVFSSWCPKLDAFFISNVDRVLSDLTVNDSGDSNTGYSVEQLTEREICKKKGGDAGIISNPKLTPKQMRILWVSDMKGAYAKAFANPALSEDIMKLHSVNVCSMEFAAACGSMFEHPELTEAQILELYENADNGVDVDYCISEGMDADSIREYRYSKTEGYWGGTSDFDDDAVERVAKFAQRVKDKIYG